jgi:hypothetical protein
VLLRKGSKPEGIPSSYRPLCLLNDLGKILEFLLACRLENHISNKGGLARNQYGFRKRLSTDDAVQRLNHTALREMNKGGFCLAISIDIRNAFNTIQWDDVLASLESWDVPPYLLYMFGSNLADRKGEIQTASGGSMEVIITGGVPQGSVVGSLLWNLTYNSVLTLDLPPESELIGFADDILIVTAAKSIEELEAKTNEALDLVTQSIFRLGLEVAADKTEAVLFTNKYKYNSPRIDIQGTPI